MIESDYAHQPSRLEEYLLENNAMLQIILHNQAYIVQFMSDIYTELHLQRTGSVPRATDPLYKQREAQANQKLDFYKKTTASIFKENLSRLKSKR